MKRRLLVTILCASACAVHANAPETPSQIRRIVAQSICLAIAYPDSAISRDSEAVYALYAPLLKVKDPLKSRQAIEKLALTAQPASSSPVGGHNLALAKCTLFAERKDVLAALGDGRAKR